MNKLITNKKLVFHRYRPCRGFRRHFVGLENTSEIIAFVDVRSPPGVSIKVKDFTEEKNGRCICVRKRLVTFYCQ